MKCRSKKFVFPKVAFCSSRKVNQPEIEMELRYTEKGPELSICGSIWNSKHTDIVMGGQCLDDMMEIGALANNSLFKRLHRLWSLWHLNGMHAGTEVQEAALKEYLKKCKHYCDYTEQCEYLKSIGLYEDNGYKYGSSWLYREIPDDDLNEIKSLLEVA